MTWIDVARVAVAVALLSIGAATDLRTRLASNLLWVAMACVGGGLWVVELVAAGAPLPLLLLPLGPILVFVLALYNGTFFEGEPDATDQPDPADDAIAHRWNLALTVGCLLAVAGLVVIALAPRPDGGTGGVGVVAAALLALLVQGGFYALYRLRVIAGGADKNALIALCVLFPRSPSLAPLLTSLPLASVPSIAQQSYPFSWVVLTNAVLLVLLVPLALMVRNLRDSTVGLHMFNAYCAPIDEVRSSHVWLLSRFHGGEHVWTGSFLRAAPLEGKALEEQLRALEDAGETQVLVTPKIPLLVFVVAGLVLSVIGGNLLLWALLRLLP